MRIPALYRSTAKLAKGALFSTLGLSARLPPGFCNPWEHGMFRDQHFLLKRYIKLGPIFKVIWSKQLLVCIVGNEIGRKFLKANETELQGASVDLSKLFAPGIIRNMEGSSHHDCKHLFAKILDVTIIDRREADLQSYIAICLHDFSRSLSSAHDLQVMLARLVTGCLVMLFYGVTTEDPNFARLIDLHLKFGPKDIVWKIGDEQVAAYAELRTYVQVLLEHRVVLGSSGFLPAAISLGCVAEPILGNLIYMVEMGRADVIGLLRWILKYMSENQNEFEALRNGAKHQFQAIVFETIRLNQLAGLIRKTKSNIEFEGFLIPAESYVRICLWEAHKNEAVFPDPFEFKSARFINAVPAIDKFAPFGLDSHRCLGPDIVMRIATLFLSELAAAYDLKPIDDGPAVLGQTIWAPSKQFAINIAEKHYL
jgi:cytochrome P450